MVAHIGEISTATTIRLGKDVAAMGVDAVSVITPYFVPDPALLTSLTLAARRGVEVDLLLPERSNHRLADFSRHRALRELVAAGAGALAATPDELASVLQG